MKKFHMQVLPGLDGVQVLVAVKLFVQVIFEMQMIHGDSPGEAADSCGGCDAGSSGYRCDSDFDGTRGMVFVHMMAVLGFVIAMKLLKMEHYILIVL
jgi:hypothetical protein